MNNHLNGYIQRVSHPSQEEPRITLRGPSVTAQRARETQSPSDGDLLAQIDARDVDALETLYDRYSGYVLALSWRVLRERQEAEEVVQDVFWQLWEGRIRYEPARGRFATWLYTVARNRSIDRLRRRRVAGHNVVGGDVQLPQADSNPEADVGLAQRRSAVREALRQLPDDQRQALELCFYDGLSHREASDQLQLPLGTVKSRIRAALTRLKNSLRHSYE